MPSPAAVSLARRKALRFLLDEVQITTPGTWTRSGRYGGGTTVGDTTATVPAKVEELMDLRPFDQQVKAAGGEYVLTVSADVALAVGQQVAWKGKGHQVVYAPATANDGVVTRGGIVRITPHDGA